MQLRHVRPNHPNLPTTLEEERQYLHQFEVLKSSSTQAASGTPFATAISVAHRRLQDKFDNKILRELISRFIISSNTSLSVVENESFQQLLQYCNPTAITISRRTASRDILTLYTKLRPRIAKALEEQTQEGRVSLTLDAWTSTTQIPFLGITAHYLEIKS